MIDNFNIWKEEYDEICKLEMEKGQADKSIARRLLIFTEGFLYKVVSLTKEEMTPDVIRILTKIREKNLMMLPNQGEK